MKNNYFLYLIILINYTFDKILRCRILDIIFIETHKTTDKYNTAIHWDGYGDNHQQSGLVVNAPGLHAESWHTFGFEWTDTYLRWYFDGKIVRETTKKEEIPLV